MESGFKTFLSGFDGAWRPMKRHAALGVVAFFLSLTLLSGCFRDPNVRKHKYLESGQRYSAQGAPLTASFSGPSTYSQQTTRHGLISATCCLPVAGLTTHRRRLTQ